MNRIISDFALISRAEFLLPNLGSIIMGLSWGVSSVQNVLNTVVLILASFAVINLSSAIGAQANTLFDYRLDINDKRKNNVVAALLRFGRSRLKAIIIIETTIAFSLVSLLVLNKGEAILLPMWMIGITLGCFYSAPPLRIKSRSWLAPITLILVLAVLPVLFEYIIFADELMPLFLVSLLGLGLTVYGVIIPTEIRDYFGDKAMNIETMTVRIGLLKASMLSMILLALGSTLIGAAFVLEFISGIYPVLAISVLALAATDYIALTRFRRLYSLSKKLRLFTDDSTIMDKITDLSAHNPQWIMLVTQTYSLLSILLLVSKLVK